MYMMIFIFYYTELKKDDNQAGVEDEPDRDIPVLICASEERIGASMATINSIFSNTQANVFFYIVTLRDAIRKIRSDFNDLVILQYIRLMWHPHICFVDYREYIENTKLRKIKYKILEFNPMVLKGKVNPDSSRPELLHPVSCVELGQHL